jgi:hypothetical protein
MASVDKAEDNIQMERDIDGESSEVFTKLCSEVDKALDASKPRLPQG